MLFSIFVSFIKWENFGNLQVLLSWGWGLFLLFVLLFLFIIISYVVIGTTNKFDYDLSLQFPVRVILGISICSFAISLFGLIGLYSSLGLVSVLAIGLVMAFLNDKNCILNSWTLLSKHFVQNKWLWAFGILISLNSMLLPYRHDDTSYHLAYPLLWFQHGEIFMDVGVRYPVYTFNFHVLALFGMVVDSLTLNHLVHWSFALIGAFFLRGIIYKHTNNRFLSIISFFAFLLTPTIQEFLNVYYIDIPYQVALFISIYYLASLAVSNERDRRLWYTGVIIAAFCVGIKVTGFIYIPFFVLLIFYPFKKFSAIKLATTVILVLLSSIWYLRSLLLTGDPIWPALKMKLGISDQFWNAKDMELINNSLNQLKLDFDWSLLYEFPSYMVISNGENWVLLGYSILGLILPIFCLKSIMNNKLLFILYLFYLLTFVFWISTSIILRYSYFILFALFFSVVSFSIILRQFSYTIWAKRGLYFLFTACIFFSWPLPISYAKNFFAKKIQLEEKDALYQAGYDTGKISSIYKLREKSIIPAGSDVYSLGFISYRYYFYDNYLNMKGDDVGIYRSSDMEIAFVNGNAKELLEQLGIKHIVISRLEYSITNEQLEKEEIELIYKDDYIIVGKI